MTDGGARVASFIDREWITTDQMARIIASVKIDPKPGIQADRVKIVMNEIINFSISQQISALLPAEDWRKIQALAKRFIEYSDAVDALRNNGFPMFKIPDDIRRDAQNLVEQISGWFGQKQSRKYRPWERVFYPSCLALYYVTFEREPVSTASEYGGARMGPTAQFIHSIISHVRNAQIDVGFDQRFGRKSGKDVKWVVPSPDTLRVNISDWKKRKRNDRQGKPIPGQPAWRRFAEEYGKRL